ncbi:hypothetical protein D9619_008883 [Psilocybe cf. subviscida]|uniref:Methyltransferase domain-containing protein n=1 Tax=Psilocybe cf. subviscida TaxID=2480587 RepID=A0A8H5BAH8_9AGAR|nr:hypothetical protein D9619_008883 [Psilocybe cf. subviscida]
MLSVFPPNCHEEESSSNRYFTSEDLYLLPSDNLEAVRLREQHALLMEIFDDTVVAAPVNITSESEILDIGTGSGAWALDVNRRVANAKLDNKAPAARITSVDIESRLFPQIGPTNANMHFRLGSVLHLPAEWDNKFTLVHQRLLIVALKREEWTTAVKEIHRVLAPGGWVQLCEVDPVSDMGAGVHTRTFIELFKELARRSGMDLTSADRIPALLVDAGFVDVTVDRRLTTLGPFGGELGVRAGRNALDVWKGMKKPILGLGGLGYLRDEGEFDAMMNNIEREWNEMSGGEFSWHTIIARKPLL